MVKAVREAAKRDLGLKVKHRKAALEAKVIFGAVFLYSDPESFGGAEPPLVRLIVATMTILGWVGFLRYSDLCQVFHDEIAYFADHMEVFLEKRKQDQFRFGDVVVIARGQDPRTCPVRLCQRLQAACRLQGHVPLFQGWDGRVARFRPGSVDHAALTGKVIPYHACRREVLRLVAKASGLSETETQAMYGTQSLRSGGCTVAATEVEQRLFQRHGGWADTRSVHRYVEDSLEDRLTVTRALGY
jgi:hypothetical protein